MTVAHGRNPCQDGLAIVILARMVITNDAQFECLCSNAHRGPARAATPLRRCYNPCNPGLQVCGHPMNETLLLQVCVQSRGKCSRDLGPSRLCTHQKESNQGCDREHCPAGRAERGGATSGANTCFNAYPGWSTGPHCRSMLVCHIYNL